MKKKMVCFIFGVKTVIYKSRKNIVEKKQSTLKLKGDNKELIPNLLLYIGN